MSDTYEVRRLREHLRALHEQYDDLLREYRGLRSWRAGVLRALDVFEAAEALRDEHIEELGRLLAPREAISSPESVAVAA